MATSMKVVVYWLIFMFFVTFTCSLMYLVAQQSMRLSANEAPEQLAVATKLKLQSGKNPDSMIPADKVNISKSLDSFFMLFDHNKKIMASSGVMGDSNPSFPQSVLNNVSQSHEDRITWQPEPGLRFATVALKFSNGYIVAAHSLQETENVIGEITTLMFSLWLACLVVSVTLLFVILRFIKRTTKASLN